MKGQRIIDEEKFWENRRFEEWHDYVAGQKLTIRKGNVHEQLKRKHSFLRKKLGSRTTWTKKNKQKTTQINQQWHPEERLTRQRAMDEGKYWENRRCEKCDDHFVGHNLTMIKGNFENTVWWEKNGIKDSMNKDKQAIRHR